MHIWELLTAFTASNKIRKEKSTKQGLFMNEALSHCDVPLQPLPLHKVILSPLV